MNCPLVSIIMPNYNCQDYIADAINSVLKQTYSNWELIIIDDFSTDDSFSIISKFAEDEKRIHLIKLKQNFGGPAKPRNIGMAEACGEYIAFLDSDDIWNSDKLSIQISYMEKNKINFTSSDYIGISSKGVDINKFYPYKTIINKISNKQKISSLIKLNFIYTSSVIIKKDLLHNFNENINLFQPAEDYLLWLELFNKENINYSFIQKKLFKYRILETSISERHLQLKTIGQWLYCIMTFIQINRRYDLIKNIFLPFTAKLIYYYISRLKK